MDHDHTWSVYMQIVYICNAIHTHAFPCWITSSNLLESIYVHLCQQFLVSKFRDAARWEHPEATKNNAYHDNVDTDHHIILARATFYLDPAWA